MSDLVALLERVKAATGPDSELDCDIAVVVLPKHRKTQESSLECLVPTLSEWRDGYWFRVEYQITASIDAAVALIGRVLPGWKWGIHNREGLYRGYVTKSNPFRPMPVIGDARTPPLALLASLLSALIAQEASR